jgi:hypothetical protein
MKKKTKKEIKLRAFIRQTMSESMEYIRGATGPPGPPGPISIPSHEMAEQIAWLKNEVAQLKLEIDAMAKPASKTRVRKFTHEDQRLSPKN